MIHFILIGAAWAVLGWLLLLSVFLSGLCVGWYLRGGSEPPAPRRPARGGTIQALSPDGEPLAIADDRVSWAEVDELTAPEKPENPKGGRRRAW